MIRGVDLRICNRSTRKRPHHRGQRQQLLTIDLKFGLKNMGVIIIGTVLRVRQSGVAHATMIVIGRSQ